MKKALLIPFVLLALCAPQLHAGANEELSVKALKSHPEKGVVTWIQDGSTLRVKLGDRIETVTLLGIDAPTPSQRSMTKVQTMGMKLIDGLSDDESKARLKRVAEGAVYFLQSRVHGQTVRLEVPENNQRDKQGRLRAFVFIDASDYCVNAELVAIGLAYIDPFVTTPYGEQLNYSLMRAYEFASNLWAKAGDKAIRFPD